MKDWYTEKRVSRSIFGSILEYEYLYLNGELERDWEQSLYAVIRGSL